jgi:hypothetical protein
VTTPQPIGRPDMSEYAVHYRPYVAQISEDDILAVLDSQREEIRAFARSVAVEREQFAYGPDKWTVRQVFGHLLDVERSFAHRAFSISRNDPTPLPGFDDDLYVAESGSNDTPLSALAEELALTRTANLALFRRFSNAAWRRAGVANNAPVSVRALAFMMAGHIRHHVALLRDLYGLG